MIRTFTALAAGLAAAGMACAQPLPAPPSAPYADRASTTCEAQSFRIYFQDGDVALTPAAEAMLTAVKARVADCVNGPVSLTAASADALDTDATLALSQKRINAVASALQDVDFDTRELQTEIAQDLPAYAPMMRSVEVRFAAWSPEIG